MVSMTSPVRQLEKPRLVLVVFVFFDVRRTAPDVTQPRARRALMRSRSLNFGLAVRVQGVIERPHQNEFLVVIWNAQLESTNECIESSRLRSTTPTRRNV